MYVWMLNLQSGVYCFVFFVFISDVPSVCWGVGVVRSGFDSTVPAFVRSRVSQAVGTDGRVLKNVVDHNLCIE